MHRGQFILRRLMQAVPVLFGITLVVFALLHLIPGDPAVTMLGMRANPDSVAALRHELGLDQPLWSQDVKYLKGLGSFNLGHSLKYKVEVSALLLDRLKVSLALIAYAILMIIAVSVPVSILCALRKDRIFDHVTRIALMVTMVMPGFWVGIIFLTLFSVRLGLFPSTGYGEGVVGHLWHLFLPALTIALGTIPLIVRSLRASLLEAMAADYVRTARAKGMGEQRVVIQHVLRNALIPAVTLLGLTVGWLMGGTVIVENVFSLPGAGKLLIDAIGVRDYPVVQSTTLAFAFLVVLANLVTDTVYTLLDPRVRLG
jgi:peptide/nickel transport system permease protein